MKVVKRVLLTGAEIVIKTLIDQGQNVIFGYPGGQVLNLYDAIYKYQDDITHILTAHEQGAAHAADGYARATGKVGVVMATSGPGATNLVTGIATAHLDSVPLLAITGNVMTSQIGTDSFQELDITGVTLPITKHNYFVSNVEELQDTIIEALILAKSGRPGPVLIDIPKDIQKAVCEYVPSEKTEQIEKFAAKEKRITDAAKAINTAKKPYIYFGGGVVSADAKDEMLALADKIDAFLGCSLMGLSAVETDNPRFLGMQGMHGHFASTKAMHESDLIIALGVRFNDRVTGDRESLVKRKKIVHIDIDGSELSKNIVAKYSLRGDLTLTLKELLPLLEKKENKAWHEEILKYKSQEEKYKDQRDGFTPKNIIALINKHKDASTPVVTDVGQHQMWAAQELCFSQKRKFISSGGLGTMGFGLPAAIGAGIATGERTILITGDGSFSMTLNELATAVSENTQITIVLINNGALGMVRQAQTLFFDKRYSNTTLMRKTDFVAVAKAFGADGKVCESLDELDKLLREAKEKKGVFLIDCKVDKDELVLPVLPANAKVDDILLKVEK